MDIPDKIWHLIAKSLNREATLQEQDELCALLREDEALQQQYNLLSRIWTEKSDTEIIDGDTARNAISRIISKAESDQGSEDSYFLRIRSKRLKYRLIAMAASLILVLGVGWFLMNSNQSPKTVEISEQPEILEAKKGSRSRSLLADGTTVWLNAGSKLYYENDFSGKTREVRLEGEAFFDVVKQPDHPFIVHTSGIDIHVLGTAFNVKSYPEDKTVETTLYRGLVEVFQPNSEAKAIQLKPNEKLIVPKAAKEEKNLSSEVSPPQAKQPPASFIIARIDSTKKENERFETAWLYSRLEFRGDNFEELAKKLERWYNVTVVFTDEKAKQLNFTGSFEKETVEQAFVALKTAVPFNYNIKGHEIIIGNSLRSE
jgi:ferric-dicitrate binding protein FerR (iron transport regulator)